MVNYSEINITFLVPFDIGFELTIVRLFSGGTTTNTWEWVASRTNPFEVTAGVDITETTDNFRQAVHLDYNMTNHAFRDRVQNDLGTFEAFTCLEQQVGFDPYETIFANIPIFILASRTLGEDFIGVSAKDDNGVLLVEGTDYVVTFNNYVAPIDTSNIDLALVRSPHYVNTPFILSTTKSVEIDVTVWDGDLTSVPSTPTYTLTRIRPTVDFTDLQTNLSPLIKSALDPKPVITLDADAGKVVNSDNNSVKWIEYVASYTDPTTNIADVTGLFSAVDGYGYHSEGVNPTRPNNRILLSNVTRRKAARNGILLIPFINDGTYDNFRWSFLGQTSLNGNVNVSTSNLSNEFIKYGLIDLSKTSTATLVDIAFNLNGSLVLSFAADIIDECKYDAKTIIFKNKFGVFETLPFFKRSVNAIDVKKEEFVNKFVSNGTYDTTKHQYKNINYEAREKLTLNSGYVTEIENESYKQLLLSDQVWLYDPNGIIPLNIETSNLELKDIKNDKLFQYTIDFKYSFDAIQNI
jgi:hypothetical protein